MIYPIVLVFCIDNVSPNVFNTFEAFGEANYMYKANLNYCAKSCHLLSPTSIKSSLQRRPHEPLTAIQHFLSSKQRSIITLPEAEDPLIILLYQVAKQESEAIHRCNYSQWKVLTAITDASEKHLGKIKDILKDIVPHVSKLMRYIEQGEAYHSRLKRKYT